ncbi:MAG: Txe/YoeB family addiction module toxin [Prevotellaceae bacterium]|jgi:toxin YoeB|nr:Txe/YoeB family addiction module toxin [Prevotellaceae bacterium]
MSYKIVIRPTAEKDIAKLKHSEPQAYRKLVELLTELREHPETGTAHPKPLGSSMSGKWSRRITQKHRLVYRVGKEDMVVSVYSAYGHYDDK